MLGYGLLGVGALVLILLGALKIDGIRLDNLKTQVKTAQANEKLAVDANASLKASCDKAIQQYKDAQAAWVKQVQSNKAKAAKVTGEMKKQDAKIAELEKALATPLKTPQEQCDAARDILHQLNVDSLRQ